MEKIDETLERLKTSPFRARFKLGKREREYYSERGIETITAHAHEIIKKRLSPAEIANDGKQTPMKNHPVFIAQHATATCCRGCLEKWHKIKKGHELTPEEEDWIVSLIMSWIKSQIEKP